MTNEDFDKLLTKRLNKITLILASKAKESTMVKPNPEGVSSDAP